MDYTKLPKCKCGNREITCCPNCIAKMARADERSRLLERLTSRKTISAVWNTCVRTSEWIAADHKARIRIIIKKALAEASSEKKGDGK